MKKVTLKKPISEWFLISASFFYGIHTLQDVGVHRQAVEIRAEREPFVCFKTKPAIF